MTIRYGFKPNGGFVVVDDDGSYWWAVAYATSPYAVAAKWDPIGTARRMAAFKESDVWSVGAPSKRFWEQNRERYAVLCKFATQAVSP
jgi:hypothetical protein